MGLEGLDIHFDAQIIMDRLLDGGARHEEVKCKLRSLRVGTWPLELRWRDGESVAMGFEVIHAWRVLRGHPLVGC